MSLLRNVKIKYKILLIALVGVTGFVLYLAINYQVTQNNSKRLEAVRTQHFPILERIDKNIVRLDNIKEIWSSAVTTNDADLAEDALGISKQVLAAYQQIQTIDSSTKQQVQNLNSLFNSYFKNAKILSLGMIENKFTEQKVKVLANQLANNLTKYTKAQHSFRKIHYDRFNSVLENADQASKNILLWGLIIGLIVIASLLLTAIAISQNINTGINNIVHAQKRMSEGDLATHIEHNCNDEIGLLSNYYNNNAKNIRELINELIIGISKLSSVSSSLLTA